VLAANIRRALAGEALNPFVPPQATLAILSLDAATAVGWYGTWSWTGWPAMAVKRRLDRAWVEGS
jgi:NADH dehydrogenase FAD-containing subunit